MSDNKTKQGKQDDIRVDSNDKSEVEFLHSQFPNKTHQQVLEAVKAAGPFRAKIIEYLESED